MDSPEKNCNVSCRPKISSSDFLLKLTEMTSTKVSVYMKTSSQIPELTLFPSALTAKKSMKMKFSADKINFNFSSRDYECLRKIFGVRGTLISPLYTPKEIHLYLVTMCAEELDRKHVDEILARSREYHRGTTGIAEYHPYHGVPLVSRVTTDIICNMYFLHGNNKTKQIYINVCSCHNLQNSKTRSGVRSGTYLTSLSMYTPFTVFMQRRAVTKRAPQCFCIAFSASRLENGT